MGVTETVNGTRPEDLAAKALAKVCHGIQQHTKQERFVLMAYVQVMMTQCSVQVLVDYLRQKGIITDDELSRRLADAYLELANQLQTRQVLMPAKPTIITPT